MVFEHFGINVPDARAMAQWYMKHLNMRAVVAMTVPPYAHFLCDESGRDVSGFHEIEVISEKDCKPSTSRLTRRAGRLNVDVHGGSGDPLFDITFQMVTNLVDFFQTAVRPHQEMHRDQVVTLVTDDIEIVIADKKVRMFTQDVGDFFLW